MNSFSKKSFLAVCICALVLVGCYTVPETGRVSFNVLPESMMTSQASSAFAGMKEEGEISEDKEAIARVKRVGSRVLRAVGPTGQLPPPEDWEFIVFDDDEMINAFAMPGGKVGVYTGILKLAETDDELAAIIGHEIAHVAARHGNERMSQALIITGGGIGLAYGVKDEDSDTQKAVMLAYGLGTTFAAQLPFSRLHENESDSIGLLYMARAGYDPRAAPRFWEKMKAQNEDQPPEFMSTHPGHDTRIKRLNEQMPKAFAIYKKTISVQ